MDILPGHTECGWATSARGSAHVIDLHGRLHDVVCLNCRQKPYGPRYKSNLKRSIRIGTTRTPRLRPMVTWTSKVDYAQFELAHCKLCGGRLKPDVVFFGENVPRTRVETAMSELEQADALVVIGSSLSVFSGYRFVRAALKSGQPVYIVNDGETRADDDATLKISADARQVVDQLQINLGIQP